MVRLDLRDMYFGRVMERERRWLGVDSWSEDAVVEGWVESGLVGILAGVSERSVMAADRERLTGSGSMAVGAEVVPSVDAMMGWFQCFVNVE